MKTLKEVENLYQENRPSCGKYEYLKDQFYSPILSAAGLSWETPVRNVITNEVGKFIVTHYGKSHLSFVPYDDNGIPKKTYKNVSKSVKPERIVAELVREYISEPDYKVNMLFNDLFSDINAGSYDTSYYIGYCDAANNFSDKKESACPAILFDRSDHVNLTGSFESGNKLFAVIKEKYESILIKAYDRPIYSPYDRSLQSIHRYFVLKLPVAL